MKQSEKGQNSYSKFPSSMKRFYFIDSVSDVLQKFFESVLFDDFPSDVKDKIRVRSDIMLNLI